MTLTLDITKLSYEAEWYDFETGDKITGPGEKTCLKVRPYPLSSTQFSYGKDGLVIKGDKQFEIFNYCLVDWRNINDQEGKPLPCSHAVKKKIYDFDMAGISAFVNNRNTLFSSRKEAEEKNLQTGGDGSSASPE